MFDESQHQVLKSLWKEAWELPILAVNPTIGEMMISIQSSSEGKNAFLREKLSEPGVLIAPGCYDAVSAALVERSGFDCAYMTGSGVSMSVTGFPDIGLISFKEVLDQLGNIADNLGIPLVADGDTGFGGNLSVARTLREFERRGASGIQLEDQVDPKKCGHELGRRCIPIADMQRKIMTACDARRDDDFVIISRTDARTGEGLDAAIERGNAYHEAGADVVFLESLESAEEMSKARAAIEAPFMANMVEGGRSPLLSRDELNEVGYDFAIFPNTILRLIGYHVNRGLQHLQETGSTGDLLDEMWLHRDLWQLFDHEDWVALEKRYDSAAPK